MRNLPLFTASALALNHWWANFRCGGSKRPSSGRSGLIFEDPISNSSSIQLSLA